MSRRTIAAIGEDEQVWDAGEIARRLRGARALQYVLGFRHVRLHLDNLDETLSPRPLIAARLMARDHASAVDGRGGVRVLKWSGLARHVTDMMRMRADWPAALREVREDLATLATSAPSREPGGEGALVVRTDLWFGLEAGGAVAHTVGMLNALSQTERPLRLVSAHDIPMLSPAIERVTPRWRAFGGADRTLLAFNRDVVDAAKGLPRPRFVYQRFGLYGYAGAILARHWRVPLVLEYNGSEVWIGDHWGQPVASRDIALEIERTMLRSADIITAVSRAALEQAVERGAPRERMLLVPNAADTDIYRPDIDGAPVRARYGLQGAIVIGFIGTFGAWHGAPLLAQAFVELKRRAPGIDLRLLMVGDGPELPVAREILVDAGYADAVVFTGLTPQAEGPTHLAAADILVSPTMPNPDDREFFGSPTKLFEYMAMGKAIVSSKMAQMADVLEHERTALLVAPGDVDALCDALLRLTDDKDLRVRLAEDARAEAVARHTWRLRADVVIRAMAALA